MNLDNTDVLPLYKQLKNIILRDIEQGVYPKGSRIPPEMELSRNYKVSRITVRNALEELTEENILIRQQGRGTFVRNNKFHREIGGIKSFSDICRENGCVPGAKTVKNKTCVASIADQKKLGVGAEDSVVVIERIRYADTLPVSYEISHFPIELSFLIDEDLNNCSMFDLLKKKHNISFSHTQKTLEITFSTKKQAKLLQIPEGYPLLFITSVSQDADGRNIHFSYQYIVGDKFKFII